MDHQVTYIKSAKNPLLTYKRFFVSGVTVKEVIFSAEEAKTFTSDYSSYCKQMTAPFIKYEYHYFSKKSCTDAL